MDSLISNPLKYMIMGTFSKTVSVAQFAGANGITKLDLVKNPNTGKLFVATNTGLTMRVSKKITSSADLTADLVVSWFTPEDGDAGYMLHPQGEAGQNVVGTLSFAPVAQPLDTAIG